MIDIAFIESRIDDYRYKVRIPKYQLILTSPNATSTTSLPEAKVCITPGCRVSYNIGDLVWVSYEQGNIGTPVIIGLLYRLDDGGTYTILSDKVEVAKDKEQNYENRFQAIEQRSNNIENGNFVCKDLTFNAPSFNVVALPIKYFPCFIFKVSIELAVLEVVNLLFNIYINIENGLYLGTIVVSDILGMINLCINKTKVVKRDYIDPRIVPEFCTGTFLQLEKTYKFGYNNSIWYFLEI